MRVFFKALASVGMIVLSTAAAVGIRHLVRKRRSRHDEQPAEPAPETKEAEAPEMEETEKPSENTADPDASDSASDAEKNEDAPAE